MSCSPTSSRGGTPVLRDEVAEALWPDGDPAQVQHYLSNAAYYRRRAMKNALPGTDVQVFVASGQRYHLRTGVLRVDVDAFDAHLRRAEALKGLEALAGTSGRWHSTRATSWGTSRSSGLRRTVASISGDFSLPRIKRQAARLAVESRDVEKAMELYRAILVSDPIDEEAARGLMRCYAKLGDVNGVRKVYKVLRESLRRELEDEKAEPLPETTALFHERIQEATRA